MKTGVLLLLCLFAVATMTAADLKLSDGRTFKDYRILAQSPTTVTVRHAGGIAKVEKKLLPADVLKLYPIDEGGAATEAEENARGKEQWDAQVRAQTERQIKEGKAKAEAEKALAAKAGPKPPARAEDNPTPPRSRKAESSADAATEPFNADRPKVIRTVMDRAKYYYRNEAPLPAGKTPPLITIEITDARADASGNWEVTGRFCTALLGGNQGIGIASGAEIGRFRALVNRLGPGNYIVGSFGPL